MTNYTLQSQMRKAYSSKNAYSFSVSGGVNGILTLSLTKAASGNIPAGRYLYDVLVTSNTGSSTRILEGQVTINPSVTR